MDLKRRIAKTETVLVRKRVHWQLKDGTLIEAYADDVVDCFVAVMRKRPHPLLGQVLNGNPSTYSSGDTFLQLIQALCKSREVYSNA